MLEIIDCDQGTNEWKQARLGLPTASRFSAILAKGAGKTRKAYLRSLAAEIVTGEAGESFESPAMIRGREMEDEARRLYAFLSDAKMERVGFIRNGNKGCSPDCFVGVNGMLEIKTQRADLLVETHLDNVFPSEHIAQCQGNLWVAEREYIDLLVYWPKMTPFIRRAYRNESYIAKLASAVDQFNDELAELVEKLKRIEPPVLREPELPRELQRMGAG